MTTIEEMVEEKKKLETSIFLQIKEFEEKHKVFIAFIRNVPYIKMNGEQATQDIRLDVKI